MKKLKTIQINSARNQTVNDELLHYNKINNIDIAFDTKTTVG
jgi:hypothetical protein